MFRSGPSLAFLVDALQWPTQVAETVLCFISGVNSWWFGVHRAPLSVARPAKILSRLHVYASQPGAVGAATAVAPGQPFACPPGRRSGDSSFPITRLRAANFLFLTLRLFFFVRFVFFFFLLSTFFLHHRRGSLNCAAPVFFVCTTLHTSRDTIPMNVGGSCVAPFFPQQWQRQRGSHARGRRQRWGIFRGPRKPSPRRGTGEGHGPSSVAGRPAECSDGWPGKLLLFFLLPGARPGPARPVRWLGETEPWEVLLQRCRMMMSGGKIVSLAMRTRYSVQHPSAVLQPASFAVEGRIQVYAPCFNVLYVRPCLCWPRAYKLALRVQRKIVFGNHEGLGKGTVSTWIALCWCCGLLPAWSEASVSPGETVLGDPPTAHEPQGTLSRLSAREGHRIAAASESHDRGWNQAAAFHRALGCACSRNYSSFRVSNPPLAPFLRPLALVRRPLPVPFFSSLLLPTPSTAFDFFFELAPGRGSRGSSLTAPPAAAAATAAAAIPAPARWPAALADASPRAAARWGALEPPGGWFRLSRVGKRHTRGVVVEARYLRGEESVDDQMYPTAVVSASIGSKPNCSLAECRLGQTKPPLLECRGCGDCVHSSQVQSVIESHWVHSNLFGPYMNRKANSHIIWDRQIAKHTHHHRAPLVRRWFPGSRQE